jgi:signal transduction histidine kinase
MTALCNGTSYNERWRFLLGWDEDGFDLRANTWRELIHPEDRLIVENALRDHWEQRWPFAKTIRMMHRSIGWRWILVRGTARRDSRGDPVRMVMIFADVDERVRAELRVRALIEAIPDTLLRVRSDGTVLAVKDGGKFEELTGLGTVPPHWLFAAISGTETGRRVAECLRTAARQAGVSQLTFRVSRPGGRQGEFDLRIVGSGDDEAVCIVRDVTREKQIEEQLSRGRRMEAIGQLAAGLAHEINTPLQYIGDNLQFIKDSVRDLMALLTEYRAVLAQSESPSQQARKDLDEREASMDIAYVQSVLPSSMANAGEGLTQIEKIVRAMKTFEEVGRQERAPVALNPLFENAMVVATHSWKAVAEIDLRMSPDLPAVPCVAGEIAQVFINLLTNAIHAIADKQRGSGKKGHVVVETSHVATEDGKSWIELRVSDDGVGIPEDVRARIFDPFFTTRGVGSGTGQGLAYAHDIVVRQHGGTIHFETSDGVGTTFVVRLPL